MTSSSRADRGSASAGPSAPASPNMPRDRPDRCRGSCGSPCLNSIEGAPPPPKGPADASADGRLATVAGQKPPAPSTCTNAGRGICSVGRYGCDGPLRRTPGEAAAAATGHTPPQEERMLATTLLPYPSWLNSGDNAWQMTAATFVGLMSVPGLVVLYGGVMQKRWSVNSMMLTFITFGVVLIAWVLWAFKMGFGSPVHLFGSSSTSSFFDTMVGNPQSVLGHVGLQSPGEHTPAGWLLTEIPLPGGLARLLPVRVRRDHADPGARQRARPRQLQGVDPVRAAVDHVRVRDRRLPDLGRRLFRRTRRAGLLRWLRDSPLRGVSPASSRHG